MWLMSKIPELLTSLSGEKIDTVEKWEKFRRREILHLFEEYVYGVRDIERPENLRFEKKYEDIFCGMRRREIRAGFDSFQFPFTLYLPLEQTKTLPAFVLVLHENMENHSYFNKEGNLIFEDSLMPVKDITDRGFAVAVMPTRDLYRDWTAHEHYQHGVLAAVKTPGGRKKNSWATISAWAWGASRVLDYLETDGDIDAGICIGETADDGKITSGDESVTLKELLGVYEDKLESVFNCNIEQTGKTENFSWTATDYPSPAVKHSRPRVLIPVFPGTNCEYDSAKAMEDAGAEAVIKVLRNLSGSAIERSIEEFSAELKNAQMVFIPGGFSGGDEPDGSGKFITAFFRSAAVKEQVTELLDVRGGLMCGICNGFQALIKLGLVPYGKIIDTDENCPTLTYNTIGRHQSRIVRTRIASNKSPWLKNTAVGEIYSVPISHGEGRFLASEELVGKLAENGQIATQYVDFDGNATTDVHFNPNNSMFAIEGITSPDGRVFGKMGHSERTGSGLYLNVPGNYDIGMFRSAVEYFR